MPEAVEGRLCSVEVLEVLEAMRCVLLCMLEAVEGGLWAVADCNEKTATMKNQVRMPIAATLFKVLCTYVLVLEVCAACARGLCCSRCSRRRFVLLVLEIVLYVLE